MTLRLHVDTARWQQHVHTVCAATPHLIPVIKGNGYGFGRAALIAQLPVGTPYAAVGTVHELDSATHTALAAADITPVVLTPTLDPPAEMLRHLVDTERQVVLTVGAPEHIAAAPQGTQVVVKITSTMQRYGRNPGLIEAARAAGLEVLAAAVHPPLPSACAPGATLADVGALLAQIPTDLEVWLSHLDPADQAALPTTHRYRHRIGTRLWHGDKSMLALRATVLDQRPVSAGSLVGYRCLPAPGEGHLIMVGAGSAHGVRPLADGRSPFHFAAHRLSLIEAPHMHTSMVFVPVGAPRPAIGDSVDVQNPLIWVTPDQIIWD